MNVDWGARDRAPHTDPAFPTLAACLGPPERGARLVNVYYYPGRTLQAVHALPDGRIVTVEPPPVEDVVPGRGVPRVPRAPLGPGETWDASLRAVVRRFPHDPGLPSLPTLAASAGVRAGEVLTYLPGRRAVLRVGRRVAKVSDPRTVRRNHDRQLQLWRHPDRSFRMAQPRQLDEPLAVRWEAAVEGKPLLHALGTADVEALAADLGSQLAALHTLDGIGLTLADHGPVALGQRWRAKTVRTIGRALPGLAPRAADLLDRLVAHPPDTAATRTLVHGDFHAANIVSTPAGVVVLDLDELGRGDPELDVAVLVGRLLLVALTRGEQSGMPGARLPVLASAFVRAYEQAACQQLRPEVFSWYLAGSLVGRQVKTSIRHLAPRLSWLCSSLVQLAELAEPATASLSGGAVGLVEALTAQVSGHPGAGSTAAVAVPLWGRGHTGADVAVRA
ncbi:MAG TPA: aminoglycoside phosphotransferase family protein [Dermatophilaceae bacterium]|nr:aminoglycoside phosphotransferase family protein [Dermatophilaceae bacterium]